MIQHIWSVLCESAAFDSLTNNVSMFNALENITALFEPTPENPVFLQGEIVSLWRRTQEDQGPIGHARIYCTAPNGTKSSAIEMEIDLTKSWFHRTRLTIPRLQIVMKGLYTFKVECKLQHESDWHLEAELPLFVDVHASPQP